MSIMNLGSGMSTFIGPAVAGAFLPLLGVSGVIRIFASLYLAAAVISYHIAYSGRASSAVELNDSKRFTCESIAVGH